MPARDLDAIVERHIIQRPPSQPGKKLPRQPHRTEAATRERAPRGALDLHGEKAPVEVRVMRDEDATVEHAEQLIADLGEGWRALHHLPGDVRQTADPRRD